MVAGVFTRPRSENVARAAVFCGRVKFHLRICLSSQRFCKQKFKQLPTNLKNRLPRVVPSFLWRHSEERKRSSVTESSEQSSPNFAFFGEVKAGVAAGVHANFVVDGRSLFSRGGPLRRVKLFTMRVSEFPVVWQPACRRMLCTSLPHGRPCW